MNHRFGVLCIIPTLLVASAYTLYLGMHSAGLPPKLTTHFDPRGIANGWMTKGSFALLSLALIWFNVLISYVLLKNSVCSSPLIVLGTLGAGSGLEAAAFWQLLSSAIESRPPNFLWLIPATVMMFLLSLGAARLTNT